jgi:recombination protein RecT
MSMPSSPTTGQQVPVKKEHHPLVVLRKFLEDRLSELKMALPPHISPERFMRAVLTSAEINPEILACDRRTLWIACMRACNDGLVPDGREAAIVPFKDKASYIPMYEGLIKQFRNSGQFKWIKADIVYEGDEYDHWTDETGEHFKHRQQDDVEGKKIRRVYAIATTKDGGSFIADLSMTDINKRKAMSRGTRDDRPWLKWEHEMQKKTALRVLSHLLPKSSDLDALIQRDENALLGVEAIDDRRQAAVGSSGISALDHFGGSAQDSPTQETGTTQAPQDQQPAATTEVDAETAQQLQAAYERGRADRAAGQQRRAVPPEFRGKPEADSWFDGWDSAGTG